jgi:probable DNA repair protein
MDAVNIVRASDKLSSPLREALASGATVVTPNNRLARRLAAIYDGTQRAVGRKVWSAPDVLPWAGWLERLWLDVVESDSRSDPPGLIGSAQMTYLWSQIVAAEGLPLIDRNGAAALATEAWSLVHAWGAGGPSWRAWAGGDDDCAAFARWAEAYSATLARMRRLDPAQLPDWIVRCAPEVSAWRGVAVTLAGFAEITPQQDRLQAAVKAAGMQVESHATVPDATGEIWREAGATPRDELVRALRWARNRALSDPGATIGIALDDLATRREEVRSLAEEILCPALQWPGHEDAARPYNVSLGTAAGEVPMIAAALDLIALAHAPLPMARAAALLRSPYVSATRDGWLHRAQLEAGWLREGRREISLDDAVAALARVDRALADRFQLARQRHGMPTSASPREWTERWRSWLAAAGWPGDRSLSSDEWQARGAWDGLLAQFATLGSVANRLPRAEALAAYAALAKRQVFQPESSPAPVQILGMLEAAGLPLDALWVTGLAAETWPPAPQPNPLLALAWQRERNVPRSTAARELSYAQALTAQWARGAPKVVFSYARSADDHVRAASSLVPAAPWLSEGEILPRTTARAQFDSAPAREAVTDDRAPTLPMGTRVRGGAALIDAQSDCPFRAMALHRLAADTWPEPVEGLSAMERGVLVHAALAAFWRGVGDHASLVALSPDALAARIDVATAAASATIPSARWHRLPAVVEAGEATRIASIVHVWLDGFERARPPFSVAETEKSRPLALGGLALELRLDRVDALADGGMAIIDYKTGLATPPAKWFDARPQGPQLGLYVLAQHAVTSLPPIRAALYVQLKPGEVKMLGIAADTSAWPQLVLPADVGGAGLADWTAVVARWTQSLGALAAEVRDGYAAVAPRDTAKTCRNCGLQALCRIGALAVEESAESGRA